MIGVSMRVTPIPKQHQDLIRQMSFDEPGWGADRIADELRLKLGIRRASSTVQKYMVRPEHRTRTGANLEDPHEEPQR